MAFADDFTIPVAAMYIDGVDPAVTYTDGRVKAGRLWLDTSTGTIGTLKKRNAANSGWDALINLDSPIANFTETVQDIVGAMFPDVATIDWTYDDATGVVTGVVIGAAPTGSAGGDLTGTFPNPRVAQVTDANGNELLKFGTTTLAVNEVTITNKATGNGPTVEATGDDTNIDLALVSKGSGVVKANGVNVLLESLEVFASDLSTPLSTGTAKGVFFMPYAMIVTEVFAGLATPQTSGSIFTVDINEAGTTILSTKITIDNGEDTSLTAVTPPDVSDAVLAKGAKITIDIDQIGDGTAKGLVVVITGVRG